MYYRTITMPIYLLTFPGERRILSLSERTEAKGTESEMTKTEAETLLNELVRDVLHDAFLPTSGEVTTETILRDLIHAANNY